MAMVFRRARIRDDIINTDRRFDTHFDSRVWKAPNPAKLTIDPHTPARPNDRPNGMVFGDRNTRTRTSEDFCHLDRDLDVGVVGGDVFCLQSLLHRRGHSNERPTGVFTDDTSDGVKAWAKTHGWNTTKTGGRVDFETRRVYGEVRASARRASVKSKLKFAFCF